MKEELKGIAKAGGAFLGAHMLCCSPLILPTAFGFAVSATYLGAIGLLAVATVYTISFVSYQRNKGRKNKQVKCAHNHDCKQNIYIKSKQFRNASFLATGVFFGAVFNYVSGHNHDHYHTHGHEHGHSNNRLHIHNHTEHAKHFERLKKPAYLQNYPLKPSE